jgi:hypothetical protein
VAVTECAAVGEACSPPRKPCCCWASQASPASSWRTEPFCSRRYVGFRWRSSCISSGYVGVQPTTASGGSRVAALSAVIIAASRRQATSSADRDLALAHVEDALNALAKAESAVCSWHYPTHLQALAEAEDRREERERDLLSRIEYLEDVPAEEQMQAASAGHVAPRQHEDHRLAQRVRRAVMSNVHPDNVADPAEREWRTRLCQDLFPEIDRIINEAKRA